MGEQPDKLLGNYQEEFKWGKESYGMDFFRFLRGIVIEIPRKDFEGFLWEISRAIWRIAIRIAWQISWGSSLRKNGLDIPLEEFVRDSWFDDSMIPDSMIFRGIPEWISTYISGRIPEESTLEIL